MDKVVPDRIEPVVAYRIWDVWIREPFTLCSSGWSSTKWTSLTPIMAEHIYNSDDIGEKHGIDKCPGKSFLNGRYNMRCGIYALKTIKLDFFDYGPWKTISGQVYLWGLIVEHELGYRAQYAYPKCLYLDGEKDNTIRMIANNYKIPAIEPPVAEPQTDNEFKDMFWPTNMRVSNVIPRDTGV